jgi:hypothetical protein
MSRDDKLSKRIKTAHDTIKIVDAMYSLEHLAEDWTKFKEKAWDYFLMTCTVAAVLIIFGIGAWTLG